MSHIERKSELKRRRHRREKVKKLRAKLSHAKNPTEAQAILGKIRTISPFWQVPAHQQVPAMPAAPAPTKGRK
jgi:hypothetical protein